LPGRELPAYLHLPGSFASGQVVELSESDSHYVARVCRAGAGDRVRATDGCGRVAVFEIVATGARVRMHCLESDQVARASEAWVLCGAPDEGRADWMIEKLAELGVARFQPVDSERSRWRTGRTERWRRVASAALRQSQQAHVLEIGEVLPLEAALAIVPADASRWSAEVAGDLLDPPRPAPARVAGLIGPAGGWTDPEQQLWARKGYRPLRLAGARLRTETAAVAWAAWWALGAAGVRAGSI